jgi:hypothetical protein
MQVKLGEIKIPKTGNMRIWDQEEFEEIETSEIEVTAQEEVFQESEPQIEKGDEEKRILEELEKLKQEEEKVVKEVLGEDRQVKKELIQEEKSQFDQAPQVDDHLLRRPSIPSDVSSHSLDEDSGHKEIFRVKSVFPFDLFPDELIIEEARIVFRKRFGPFTKRVYSMLIKDISQSRLTTSLLFGRIMIQDIFGENEITIDYLWKKKAYLVKGILDRLQARERRRVQGVPAEDISEIVKQETLEEEEEKFFDTGW